MELMATDVAIRKNIFSVFIIVYFLPKMLFGTVSKNGIVNIVLMVNRII